MLLIFAITAFTLIVCYLKLKHFTIRGSLPAVPPQFLFGNLLQSGLLFRGKTLAEVFLEYKARFGDIFQFYIASTRILIVSNADDVQHIFTHRNIYDQSDVNIQLFGSFAPSGMVCNRGYCFQPSSTLLALPFLGAKYKRHAAIIVPLFRRGRIASELNFDLIISNTDKLLDRWRTSPKDKIHTDIAEQCRNLLLAILGFIAFDYDLQALDDDRVTDKNELSEALQHVLIAIRIVVYVPPILMRSYLKWSPQYQKAYRIIEHYVCRMIEQEQKQSPGMINERKRTSLIASLVASLQQNEEAEANKSEAEKKGENVTISSMTHVKNILSMASFTYF